MKRVRMLLIAGMLVFSIMAGLGAATVEAERKVVRYQTELDYPPYKFSQNGFEMGFDLELTHLIFKERDYTLFYSASDWKEAYQALVGGSADTAGLMAVQENRKQDILFSKPIMQTYIGVYAGESFQGRLGTDQLNQYTVGVGAGQYSEEILQSEAGVTSYRTYPTVEAALMALNRGEIDLLFENENVVDYLIVKREMTGEVHKVLEDLYPRDVAYGVSKKTPELVDYINGRMDELKRSGVYEELYLKYFFTHSESFSNAMRNRLILVVGLLVGGVAASYWLIRVYIIRLRRTIHGERGFSKEVLDHTNLFIWAVQSDRTTVRFNRYAEWITGIREGEAVGRSYMEHLLLQHACRELIPLLDEALSHRFVDNRELNLFCANQGKAKAFLFRTAVIPGLQGDPDVFIMTGVDIEERKQFENKLHQSYQELESANLELTATQEELKENYDKLLENQERLRRSEERYRLVADASNGGIWELDLERNRRYYSPRWFELLGYSQEDPISTQRLEQVIHPDDTPKIQQEITALQAGEKEVFECEYRLLCKDGEYRWFLGRGKALFNEQGRAYRMVGSNIEVHQLRMYQQRMRHLAYYDTLSDLPNRLYLLEEMDALVSRANAKAALFFVDTDNFKYINDTLGHKFGDRLLMQASSRLTSLIEDTGMLFRLGGDEFVILLKDVEREQATALADKLLQGFREPFRIDDSDLFVSVSIGISFYPQDGRTPEEILKNADVAMYAAKEAGKGKYVVFDPVFLQAFNERVHLEKNLRQALTRGEFTIHYQPQLGVRDGHICGFEALIRWNSPELGYVSPLSFIKIAEDSRLIVPIGEWVLEESCAFAKRLEDDGFGMYKIAVNISVVQLLEEDFVSKVLRILQQTGLAPECLELEITESMIMETVDSLVPKLNELKAFGIQIALDDFGTGYSSLGSLKQMPITTLKVDRTFIEHLPEQDDSRSLAKAIVLIGRKMGLQVVAEGVETEQQMQHVRRAKCDIIQGYYISKPLPEAGIRELLRSYRPQMI
ncbi:EAL domain-containing protein [Paenibacillus sp. DXFW5]|uniref:EAL domain-containing protein n=1 Tax=Paenibacillus rhizolycopersici TaxID=2780073 RepID=A0ABS2H086_9BACL|nr:EAL domain-containing protein [Paenibacillus rhizolycopersici]MBM6994692.1 EAL domain-containing protein [Paenibacillus rhizolycopersici]